MNAIRLSLHSTHRIYLNGDSRVNKKIKNLGALRSRVFVALVGCNFTVSSATPADSTHSFFPRSIFQVVRSDRTACVRYTSLLSLRVLLFQLSQTISKVQYIIISRKIKWISYFCCEQKCDNKKWTRITPERMNAAFLFPSPESKRRPHSAQIERREEKTENEENCFALDTYTNTRISH